MILTLKRNANKSLSQDSNSNCTKENIKTLSKTKECNDQTNDSIANTQIIDPNIALMKNKVNLINIKHKNIKKSQSPDKINDKNEEYEDEFCSDNHSSSKSSSSPEKDEVQLEHLFSDEDKEESKPVVIPQIKNVYVPEKPFVPTSPVLHPHEKREAKEFGHSMDTKLLKDEFFFIDLEKMCFCLAISIQRHIHFSRGFLFLDDLAKFLKTGKCDDRILDCEELSQSENELRFSYCFPDKLKLNNEITNRTIDDGRMRVSEENSNIQKAIEGNGKPTKCIFPSINLKSSLVKNKEIKINPEIELNEDLKYNNFDLDKKQSSKYCNPSRNFEEEDSSVYNDEIENENEKEQKFEINNSHRSNKIVEYNKGNQQKSFNLPSIVNSKRPSQQIDSDFEGSFYQNESENGLSPDIVKRKKAKGLHNYEGNKENIISNSTPSSKNESQFKLAIKPTAFDIPSNQIQMNFGCDPMSESDYNPIDSSHNQEPPPLDEAEQLEASSLFESVYVMEGEADQIKMHIKSEMEKFNIAYDIDAKCTIELAPEEKEILYNPYFDDIFNYIKYVCFKSKMESEIPIISLIYIEKLLRKCGVLVNYHNWRRIVLITLCIGSKIWDDDSLENIHFPKVMGDITLKDISTLEQTFLNLIEYDIIIRGKEYAKYYFIMTTLGKDSKKNPPWRLMNPSNVQKIEGESVRMQEQLKMQYAQKE